MITRVEPPARPGIDRDRVAAPERPFAFASDNTSGVCPEAWAALAEANAAPPCASYGADAWTARASDAFRALFERDCDVYFVFNGTAANSLALASLCQSYHAVICHELAHVETDECGAPEFYSNGSKLITCPGADGKLAAAAIVNAATRRRDLHYPRARALSFANTTELGTAYRPDEIAQLTEAARGLGMRVHCDGARFANAVAASPGATPADLSWRAGVDVLCLGGTKNGMAVGEAVIFFDRALSAEFAYRCKQAGQLASKMRFLAAPWARMLEDGAWLRHAAHANAMAARLSDGLCRALPGATLIAPTQANAVFIELPPSVAAGLRERGWQFYTFIGAGGARLMCSWDTRADDVDALVADVAALAGRAGR